MNDLLIRLFCAIVGGAIAYVLCRLITMHIINSKDIKPIPTEERIEVLRKYSEFQGANKAKRISSKFVFGKDVPDILEKYNYEEFISQFEPNTDEMVFGLLNFVCNHFHHIGNAVLPYKRGLEDIVGSCEESEGYTNCRGLSLILAELLRKNNIKARHITCMPYENPFSDCHVVVDCIMPSGKRIMLDPTYRLFLTDEAGEYVSVQRFRDILIAGKTVTPNADASYNGGEFDLEFYRNYMSKNLFRFAVNTVLDDSNSDNGVNEIELVPKGYSVKWSLLKKRFACNLHDFWEM